MLIVLDVEKAVHKNIAGRLRSLIHPYEITTRVKKQNRVTVLYIRYSSHRGAVRFKKIYEYMIGAPKTILCSSELSLEGTPFTRFESNELKKHLMMNLVTSIIRRLGHTAEQLKLGFYDPMAENSQLASRLLTDIPELTVVSDMPRFYERESERLTEEMGASFLVSNSPERLSGCDIVICPEKTEQRLPVSDNTLIFTTCKPRVSMKGTVIYEYLPEYPYRYERIKPSDIDEVYFLSALYSLCGVKELSELVPLKCGDGSTLYSTDRLVQRLKRLKTPDELLRAE